jgi:2-polyprenyl-3-methyl-5-hydroxy-6-metoxy-1,4-benzoquinol methylase
MMTADEERVFYANYEMHLSARAAPGSDTPETLFETTTPAARERAQLVQRYLNPAMAILEIGASTGAFLHAIRDNVAEVVGVEPSVVHAEHMGKLGIRTVACLEDLEAVSRFDAAGLFHVLEHMRSPVTFLQNLRTRLRENG